MNALRYAWLLLILATLAGCAAHKRTVLLPSHPAVPQGASLVAQFGARLSFSGQSAPIQGEVQIAGSGGNLVLILPHGKTLGICTYSADTGTDSAPGGASGAQAVKMECTPAEGMGREAASLLSRAGVAVYRILPAISQSPALPQLEGKSWSARFSPAADGVNGVYTEQNGMVMDMYFVEILHL